jgi:leucyl aminopeptidase (aminopeptidase T)
MISFPGISSDKEIAMVDERVGKLARLLVDYAIQAGEGGQVLISGDASAGPLIRALYARLLQAGATPATQISLPGMQEIFFEHAQELQLGGTVRLAIGRSYAQTGGKNDSSVQTDLVCDLREGGELYADGELIQENGGFRESDLAGVNNAR